MNATKPLPGYAVIVVGQQACGKTRNAQALAAHFGKTRVIDDYQPGMQLTASDLALTNDQVMGPNVFGYTEAMEAAGLTP